MNQNEEEEEMTEEPKPTATEETMKPPLWPKIGAIVICAILIVAGFAYLLIKLDELERKINEQDGTSDTVNDLIMEINQLRNDVLVLQNDLANLSEEYEYLNSTVSGLSDLTTDIWILQNEVTSIQSELQRLSVDIENNTGNISSIQNEVNMLISSMNSVIISLNNLEDRVYFLEHHVVRITVERFYPKINDCVVGNTCDTVRVEARVNNTTYALNYGNLAPDSQFDSVWLNWSFTCPNIELALFFYIEFEITYAFGVFDIDGTSDSIIVSIVYDVVNRTWSGEDDDGHTDGALDGIGGEFDTEFWYSIETL